VDVWVVGEDAPTVFAKNVRSTVPSGGRFTVAGLKDGVMLFVKQQESCWPVTGPTDAANVAVPAKLPKLFKTRSVATVPPRSIVIELGTDWRVYSCAGTLTVKEAEAVTEPPVPVTMSV